MKNNLSVVLIAHNEEANIRDMVLALMDTYGKEIFEIVVVDDNSTDRTAPIVMELQERYKNLRLVKRMPPCGVGRALKAGFSAVDPQADYVLTMDSDFIHNIDEVRKLIDEVEKGCDGVIGSRYTHGGKLINYPFFKKMMNRSFHLVLRIFCGIKACDVSNNFKLYRRRLFQELPYLSNDFAMNAETGILPIFFGYEIREVPVSWIGRTNEMGKSKFSILKYALSYFRVITNLLGKKYTAKYQASGLVRH